MAIRIQVLENNTVELFNDGEETPFLYQPSWPNGTEWTTEEAQVWADMYALTITEGVPFNPNGPF